jgi:hypothetical protein
MRPTVSVSSHHATVLSLKEECHSPALPISDPNEEYKLRHIITDIGVERLLDSFKSLASYLRST